MSHGCSFDYAHIGISICWRHLITLIIRQIRHFFGKHTVLLHTCAPCSGLPSYINTMEKKGLTLQFPGPRSRFLETIRYFIRFSRYFKEIWRTVTILCMNKIYIFWSKKYFLQRAQRTVKISGIQRRTCLLFLQFKKWEII